MNELVKEVLSLAETEARWLDDSARNFELVAIELRQEEKAEWDLLASTYRERAQAIQCTIEKARENFADDGPAELRLENS
jgi:hypothetical protein